MIKKLTSSEIGEVYNDILMFGGEGLKGLELKQIVQIEDHAKQIERQWMDIGFSWLSAPSNYCPEEYKDGREVEWFLSTKPQYLASLKVKGIIGDYLETKREVQTLPIPQIETDKKLQTIIPKPVFKPEIIQPLFEIIKDFFSPNHQKELINILETGDAPSEQLTFLANGNRLTDTFKKLIECDLITGCDKQVLIGWIMAKFTFVKGKEISPYKYDTVEKIISRNDNQCKNPLIEVQEGKIIRIDKPRKKKYSK